MPQLAQAIDHRPADAATVDHDRIGPLLVGNAGHLGCQRHRVDLLVNVETLALGVAPLPQVDHAAVIAEPGDVDAHDQRLTGTDVHLEIDAPLDIANADELQRASVWEHATHAHLEEVAVLAVVLFPLCKQLLVGLLDVAAVDEAADVVVAETPDHVLVETPAVPRRVAEVEGHRLAVGQAALAHLVDPIRHG